MDTEDLSIGVSYRRWLTDKAPEEPGPVRCLSCDKTDLRWVPKGGVPYGPATAWKLCEVGPWYTGWRLTEHRCQGGW